VSWGNIGAGFRRIATGVFMMLLARLLGQGVLAGDGISSGFDHATHWTGADVWCLSLGYGLQLFFDFAGYSHIAIGAAQALGLIVPENFSRPFESASPSIFWTRWHMSLSFWIRDYVFLPLAVLCREMWWRNLALVISMVVFGLWHKASWLFLLWGCYHGVLLVGHRQVQQWQRKFDWTPPPVLWTAISWIATIALVSLGWIFFRANTLAQAGQMLSATSLPTSYLSHRLSGSLYFLVIGLAAGYAVALFAIDVLNRHSAVGEAEQVDPRPGAIALMARWRWFWIAPLYAVAMLFLLIVTFSHGATAAQFMYGNF
jgi:alginate O-acetyltransferase complex protein AlgI